MSIIAIDFTIEEAVKLISCCNQAIVNIEDRMHDGGIETIRPSINGITLKGSLDMIWEIKTKIKENIIKSLGQSTKHDITIRLDLKEWIKLNGCFNSAIETEEKTIGLLPSNCACITTCNESIQKIIDIKCKIKHTLIEKYEYFLYS